MKRIIFLLSAMLFVVGVNAKERTLAEKQSAALRAINATHRNNAAPREGELKQLYQTEGFTVLGYESNGFAVVSNDDVLPEILAVSDSHFSGNANPNFAWWLRAINEVCEDYVANGAAASSVPTPTTLGFEPYVEPIVKAEWDQDTPYWNMCPKKNGRTALTGCVATAIAQVLYTHKTPIVGNGTRTNTSWSPVTFDYNGWTPDYANMIDQYTSGPKAGQYTEEQANAMAELMLACGVAVNMDYGADGSGAYTDQAAEGIIQYMGITTADFKERDNYSDIEWMTMVYEELEGGHAMYYSAVDSNPWLGGGHAFVCDGYDENGKVHINWGWSGEDNGYFNINLLNPGSYQFSEYQDFIRGLWDPDEAPGSDIDFINLSVEMEEGVSLADAIGADNFVALKTLSVKGAVSNDDLALLKRLATGDELADYGVEGEGHLTNLDLSYAVLENNELVDEAFKDCGVLRTIKLPRGLARIGTRAFANCKRLASITSFTYEVPKMGTRVFENLSSAGMQLMFVAGSTEYYKRNAQWKTIVSDTNTKEFGTTLKAKNATREEGTENPVFGFSYEGVRVTGTPHIWTEAGIDAAPGKYPIYIEAGDIVDNGQLFFVPGTLTVKKAEVKYTECPYDDWAIQDYGSDLWFNAIDLQKEHWFYFDPLVSLSSIEYGKEYTLDDMYAEYTYVQDINTNEKDFVTKVTFIPGDYGKSIPGFEAWCTTKSGASYHVFYQAPEVPTEFTEVEIGEVPNVEFKNFTATQGVFQFTGSDDFYDFGIAIKSEGTIEGTYTLDDVYGLDNYTYLNAGIDEIKLCNVELTVTKLVNDNDYHFDARLYGYNGNVYIVSGNYIEPTAEQFVDITATNLDIDDSSFDLYQMYYGYGVATIAASNDDYSIEGYLYSYGDLLGHYRDEDRSAQYWKIIGPDGEETEIFSANFDLDKVDGVWTIKGSILCKNNVQYNLDLSGEYTDPYDAKEGDIDVAYTVDEIEEYEVNYDYVYLSAKNEERSDSWVTLIYIDENGLPAGTYPINDTYKVGTVQAGVCKGNSVYPTMYMTLDGEGYVDEMWYCSTGTVTVSYDEDDNIQLECNAVNTNGVKVHVTVNAPNDETGIKNVDNSNSSVAYNIAGQRVSDSAKGIVIKNGQKRFVK